MTSRRNQRKSRRGSIYFLTMAASLLVATIGLGSLLLLRVQGQTAAVGNDFIEARLYARSAIDIGMLKARQDAMWRTNLGNGAWVTNQPIGSGTFSLSVVDPIDNDVTKGDNDPVILTATGTLRNTTYKTSVRVEIGPAVGGALEISMTSNNDTSLNGATLTSNQTVCANGQFSIDGGSTVNANVEAVQQISGGNYTKAKLIRTTPRSLPDPLHVFDYYMTNGTTIQYTDLQMKQQPEMLTNTTFELDLTSWYKLGSAQIQQSNAQTKEGLYSVLVKNRSHTNDTVAQDLSAASLATMQSGNNYSITLPIFCQTASTASVVLSVTNSSNITQTFTSPPTSIAADGAGNYHWTDVTATFTPTWTGTLTKATVYPTISSTNAQFYMDKVTMTDVTFPKNVYAMDRALLCPAANPFGSGQTNANGIYIVNCAGKDVVIGRMRIVGTLVMVNPGGHSLVQGPLVWEAALPNYPALMVNDTDGGFGISMGSAAFSEANLGVNLNPTGTPYPYTGGTSNTTLTDSYPSQISGIVYSSRELDFSGSPSITGVVISADKIKVSATSLNLSYNNIYLNNTPPGFACGIPSMKTVPGTWQRIVP